MIPEFERLAKQYPNEACFTFREDDDSMQTLTYNDLRLHAETLATLLQKKGVERGDLVSVDMSNCPAFVITILAGAYGGFTLAIINHRLTDEEKEERLADLRLLPGVHLGVHLDENKVIDMLEEVEILPQEAPNPRRGFFSRMTRSVQAARKPLEDGTLTYNEIIHFAERDTALFDRAANALVLFTSGTTGRPKAVQLTWENLCGAAEASNAVLDPNGRALWQAALPLYHIGGFEIIVRSILNATPFLLYRHFNAAQILADVDEFGANYISVVNKMLQDMVKSDRTYCMKKYACILLGGAAANPVVVVRAVSQSARLFVSYGMTETSSQIASIEVNDTYDGGLELLPGYEVQIMTPDERGYGQLAVKGPGVFSSYLNARAAFTADGFFLTGDTASFAEGKLKVQERVSDMFVSGGENVYPAEIQDKLLRVPGISDAYAFGVVDKTWGWRPVAFAERASHEAKGLSPQVQAEEIKKSLEPRLSKLYRPRHVCVLDEFPRTAIGKVDKERLRGFYEERLEVHEITLYAIRQELVNPFATAKTKMQFRESLIVEIKDWAGRTGIAECVAFPTDWYLPETLGDDARVLVEHLIPLVLRQVYLHPCEVTRCFEEVEEAAAYPMAQAALEPALWDLYGKIVGKPLWQLIGGEDRRDHRTREGDQDASSSPVAVPGGVVLGIMPLDQTLETVNNAVRAGYTRVKLKIKPGDDIERVRAVRRNFPGLQIMLDANQSYIERDADVFQVLDTLGITCIEEPLDPLRHPRVGPTDFLARIVRLQKALRTPLCLDESLVTFDDMYRVFEIPELQCVTLKIGKWGGIQNALDFYHAARRQGIELWMGGMYETGVSKRLHAAFETLPGITIPGDLSSTKHYFTTKISNPPFEVVDGMITLNQRGFETGLGCELDKRVLEQVSSEVLRFTREDLSQEEN